MLTHMNSLLGSLLSWARSTRASVSIEFVLGAVLILTTTVGGIDLYRIIEGRSVGARSASAMADYVSLETAPQSALINDLAKFLYRHQIAAPSEAVFVISAVAKPASTDVEPDPSAVVQWDHKVAIAPEGSPPPAFANSCGKVGASGGVAKLPVELNMEADEEVVVVEVCVKLSPEVFVSSGVLPDGVLTSLLYSQQIRPSRSGSLPGDPS